MGKYWKEKFRQHKERISLLLFDVIMPKQNGLDTYEMIRSEASDKKVLFMSGYSEDFLESRKGVLHKDSEVLRKPVEPLELLARVRQLLDQ